MAHSDIVVIGGSAGAVEAMRKLVAQLPPDIKASIFVVIHVSPHIPSQLPEILGYVGKVL